MSTATSAIDIPARPSGFFSGIAWHWRHNPKIELWIMWWGMIFFYNLFGIVFCGMAHVMPPPGAWVSQAQIVHWFAGYSFGIRLGFALMFLTSGLVASTTALIAYTIARMSVSRAFVYGYIGLYSLSTIPGMLLTAIPFTVGAMRPDRSPQLLNWIYDLGFLGFDATMGVFFIGTFVWMLAILLDKNRVYPQWFAYLNICNLITEFVVAPCVIFRLGPFSWNGAISFWIDTMVFVFYTIVFFVLMWHVIARDDFKDGVLPPRKKRVRAVEAERVPAVQGHLLGNGHIWFFVLFEACIFTSYFTIYMVYRMRNPELYLAAQQHLHQGFGVFNTLILLLSSLFMARCAQSARQGGHDLAMRHVWMTIACGVGFCISKAIEWHWEISHGITISTNEFFSFYYFMTGIHLFHVIMGFIFLGVVVYQLKSPKRRSQEIVEVGATYWHMVDFLWVIIFALIYVMR